MKSKIRNLDKFELQKLLDTSDTYSEVLNKIGMRNIGGNIITLKKVVSDLNLNLDNLNANRKKIRKRIF